MITARQASPFGPLGRAASEITGHREKNWAVKKNSEVWRKTESDKCINYQKLPKCLLSLFFVQMYTEKNSRTQGCKGNRKWQLSKSFHISQIFVFFLFVSTFVHIWPICKTSVLVNEKHGLKSKNFVANLSFFGSKKIQHLTVLNC